MATANDQPNVAQSRTSSVNSGTIFSESTATFFSSSEKNILNNYRSYTYNWALGALTPEALNDFTKLESDIKTYNVLNSTGKGTNKMQIAEQGLNTSTSVLNEVTDLVGEYNAVSPGRFDMYIDNIAVESLIGPGSRGGGMSVATGISFEVIEPYSMNGFIEALQVAGRAAGYSDYLKACYALRVQFQGYPDTPDVNSVSQIVPNSTRFFPIKITEVAVDVNESGTKYKISSVPIPQIALGNSNRLTTDVKVDGNTVGDVLKNLFDAVNKSVQDRTTGETDQKGYDVYQIACPKFPTVGTKRKTSDSILNSNTTATNLNDIVNSKMNEELVSNNVFKFDNAGKATDNYPGATSIGSTATTSASSSTSVATSSTTVTSNTSTNAKLVPKTGTVVFGAGSNLHDCIAAVIRDSLYTQELLKPENLDKVKQGDGLITYFTIRMEVDILPGYDTVNNKNFYTYRYIVEPYKMHYTRIPGQEQTKDSLTQIKKYIKRNYNYIYTGKNVDILKFGLKFDTLYYAAIPAMLGNRYSSSNKGTAAANDNGVTTKQNSSTVVTNHFSSPINSAPMASKRYDINLNQQVMNGAKAGQPQSSPYAKLAQAFHDALLDNVDLITGTLSIVGDPYYLVTGGMANVDTNLAEPQQTTDGQAPTTQGDVYININFRNPVDINPQGGYDFGANPISFSGVYRITTLRNFFKEGIFTQDIDIIRVPGQVINNNEAENKSTTLSDGKKTGSQVTADSAAAEIIKSGIRPSDFNLQKLLGISAKTNALGAITGVTSSLLADSGLDPLAGLSDVTNGFRVSSDQLSSLIPSTNNLGASYIDASNNIAGLTGNASVVQNALSSASASSISNVNNATSSLSGNISTQANNVINSGVGAASSSIGNVTSQVNALKEQAAGISSIGSSLGIDTSLLSGLSGLLSSDLMSSIETVLDQVPENTNISALGNKGLIFNNVTSDTLQKLPAIQPSAISPAPIPDTQIYNSNAYPTGFGLDAAYQGNMSMSEYLLAGDSRFLNVLGVDQGITNAMESMYSSGIPNVSSLYPASLGLGSVESNQQLLADAGFTPNGEYGNLGISISSVYQSSQDSPLTALLKGINL